MTAPYLIGITGGSGSGKTRLLNDLLQNFSPNELSSLSLDNYYQPRDSQQKDENGVTNFDRLEAIDLNAFKKDILSLKSGKPIIREEYTFNNPDASHNVIKTNPASVIIVEGLFILHHNIISDLLDFKIFVDAPDHIKLKRRILRDNVERGYDLNDVLYRFENHVMPAYRKYIAPYKAHTDLVINNHISYDNALPMLTTFIKSKV